MARPTRNPRSRSHDVAVSWRVSGKDYDIRAEPSPNFARPRTESARYGATDLMASRPDYAPTNRLYYADPLLLEFRARVTARGELGGKTSVLLDQTAFYPESGGQMADRGLLFGLEVLDVQADDDGAVHHVLAGDAPPIGTEVTGQIDPVRRRVHMALHTGQHILSRALLDVAQAETVSARLGETACTIDVDSGSLAERDVARAEDLAHSVIDGDVVIRSFFPDEGELARLPLRRAPKVSDHVRVVQIGDFDWTPCGGTHCLRSAQVGLIHVIGVERYKGGTRVTFGAGRRAREQLVSESVALRALAQELSSGLRDVPSAVDRLRRELSAAREALGQARAHLADHAAAKIFGTARSEGHETIVAALDDAPPDLLRAIAKRVGELPRAVVFLAGRDEEGAPVIVSRGGESTFDCGAFLKRAAQAAGGRGGGRPERAEGRIPAGVDWPALVRSLLDEVEGKK
jgi:alanyl-tRNA synthetase